MTLRERIARAMCVAEKVDPDAMGYGQGWIMQKDMPYRLWEARLHLVDAALDTLASEIPAPIAYAGHNALKTHENYVANLETPTSATYRDAPSTVFRAMIAAIKEGK